MMSDNQFMRNLQSFDLQVTVKKLQARLTKKGIKDMAKSTALKTLKRLGFKFKKRDNRLTVMERTDIVAWRHR